MSDPITYISNEGVPGPIKNAISREIEQVPPSNYTPGSRSGPIFTTFAALQADPTVNAKLESAVENDLFALVMPPVHGNSRSTSLTTIGGEELTIQHTDTEKIHLGQQIFPDTTDQELSVSTIGYFESYTGRGLGRDQNDEPVLVELRETSTTGGALFTTVALNKLAVSGNEQHRRDLLSALLSYLDEAITDTQQVDESGAIEQSTEEKSDDDLTILTKRYDAGILTLYYYLHTDETVELTSELSKKVLPTTLATAFTDEEWEQFIDAAERDGLIDDSGLQPEAVSEAVDERNLRSFARRLAR